MESNTNLGTPVLLAAGLLLLTIIACEHTPESPAPAGETASPEARTPSPIPPTPTPEARKLPLPPPTPTLEERKVQTPTDYGGNTRVVDGDIHVWHVPTCPPVPPATWVASIILTHLGSGSHLYLNRDGSVRTSPPPDYRTDEGRERLAGVLEDSSLMKTILTPPECP